MWRGLRGLCAFPGAGLLLTLGGLAGLGGCATGAGPRADRPDYPQAFAELRVARELLREPATVAPVPAEAQAAAHIDEAMGLLRVRVDVRVDRGRAAGSSQPAQAPTAPELSRVDRVHYALTHLDSARGLLSRPEYAADRRDLRNEAISCVARAEEALGRAMEDLLR